MRAGSSRAATTCSSSHGPPERFREADVAGISRRRLSGRPALRAHFPDWFRVAALVAREFRPDVAHTQSVRYDADRSRSPLPRTPLVATVHGIEESEERAAALLLRAGRARVTAVSEASADGRQASPPGAAASRSCCRGVDIEQLERARARSPGDGDSRAPAARRVHRAPLSGQGRRRARGGLPAGARSRTPAPGSCSSAAARTPTQLIARVAELGIADCRALRGPPAQPGRLSRRGGPRRAALAPRGTARLGTRGARTRARGRRHGRRRHARRRARRARRAGSCRPSSRRRSPPPSSRRCSTRRNARAARAWAASSWRAAIRWR